MNELTYVTALLLGVVQGITEFLPISSSGHLALLQHWIDLDAESTPMLLFDVCVHVGTVVAVIVVFRRAFGRFVRGVFSPSPRTRSAHIRYVLLPAGIATAITGAIGVSFKDSFESAFGSPALVGGCLMVTGVWLAAMRFIPRGRRGWKRFRWWESVLVGLAQAMAILPGISRSGATICTASYLGWRRRWAAEFSFLIAVPAILGGTLLQLKDTFALPAEELAKVPWGPILCGSLAAMAIGAIALILLLAVVQRAKLHYFAIYCWLLGVLVLVS